MARRDAPPFIDVSLAPDPVIDAYKKDVDRTLIRENLDHLIQVKRAAGRARILVPLLALAVAAPAGAQDVPALDVAVVARAMEPGEVISVYVTCACATNRPRATAFGADIPLAPLPDGRWHGLAGIDLDTKPGVRMLTVDVPDPGHGTRTHATELAIAAKQFPVRRLRVAAEFVVPPAGAIDRIVTEARTVDGLVGGLTPRAWSGRFVPPVPGPATGNFGFRSVFNGQVRSPHAGIDFSRPAGTPVAAPAGGRVVLAEDLYFTGNTVIVDHGDGLFSLYAHLSALSVERSDRVEQGAILGLVGATGRATGPHLHWAVRLHGARVDPLSLLAVPAPPGAR
jgi:hypothetical protein